MVGTARRQKDKQTTHKKTTTARSISPPPQCDPLPKLSDRHDAHLGELARSYAFFLLASVACPDDDFEVSKRKAADVNAPRRLDMQLKDVDLPETLLTRDLKDHAQVTRLNVALGRQSRDKGMDGAEGLVGYCQTNFLTSVPLHSRARLTRGSNPSAPADHAPHPGAEVGHQGLDIVYESGYEIFAGDRRGPSLDAWGHLHAVGELVTSDMPVQEIEELSKKALALSERLTGLARDLGGLTLSDAGENATSGTRHHSSEGLTGPSSVTTSHRRGANFAPAAQSAYAHTAIPVNTGVGHVDSASPIIGSGGAADGGISVPGSPSEAPLAVVVRSRTHTPGRNKLAHGESAVVGKARRHVETGNGVTADAAGQMAAASKSVDKRLKQLSIGEIEQIRAMMRPTEEKLMNREWHLKALEPPTITTTPPADRRSLFKYEIEQSKLIRAARKKGKVYKLPGSGAEAKDAEPTRMKSPTPELDEQSLRARRAHRQLGFHPYPESLHPSSLFPDLPDEDEESSRTPVTRKRLRSGGDEDEEGDQESTESTESSRETSSYRGGSSASDDEGRSSRTLPPPRRLTRSTQGRELAASVAPDQPTSKKAKLVDPRNSIQRLDMGEAASKLLSELPPDWCNHVLRPFDKNTGPGPKLPTLTRNVDSCAQHQAAATVTSASRRSSELRAAVMDPDHPIGGGARVELSAQHERAVPTSIGTLSIAPGAPADVATAGVPGPFGKDRREGRTKPTFLSPAAMRARYDAAVAEAGAASRRKAALRAKPADPAHAVNGGVPLDFSVQHDHAVRQSGQPSSFAADTGIVDVVDAPTLARSPSPLKSGDELVYPERAELAADFATLRSGTTAPSTNSDAIEPGRSAVVPGVPPAPPVAAASTSTSSVRAVAPFPYLPPVPVEAQTSNEPHGAPESASALDPTAAVRELLRLALASASTASAHAAPRRPRPPPAPGFATPGVYDATRDPRLVHRRQQHASTAPVTFTASPRPRPALAQMSPSARDTNGRTLLRPSAAPVPKKRTVIVIDSDSD